MFEDVEIIKQIKIDEAAITLRSDGIVHVLFQNNIILDVHLQMLLLNISNDITERKKHPFLYEGLPGIKVTKEARENAFDIESEAPGNAYAVVAPTIGYRVLGKFYTKTRKTINPYRVFSKKENAIKWLKRFVVENKTLANF